MKIHSISHQGYVRSNNEDRLLVREYEEGLVLLAVADGMGGHAAGERAAEIAVKTLGEFAWTADEDALPEQLVEAVRLAQKAVLDASLAQPELGGMGTTITVALVAGSRVFWAGVGDSRLCLFRGGGLTQITWDHTIPGTLLQQGKITREQARVHPMGNVLLKCIGCERFDPDTGDFSVQGGDLLMLSSDGMHDLLPDRTVVSILGGSEPLEEKLKALVWACLDRGGRDNITAIGAEI